MEKRVPSISIVLPAYNEAENLPQAVAAATAAASAVTDDYEVIVVNDGSRDNSAEILTRLKHDYPYLRVVTHEVNRGYGGAVRSGYAAATKELVCLNAADNQFDLRELTRFLPFFPEADIVVGDRAQRQDNPIRRLNAWGWNTLVRLLFGYTARDIDCGFKVFKRSVLPHVHLTSNGAMVDTEFLVGAKVRGFVIKETPVTHLPRLKGKPTGANLRVILRAFRDLFRFYWRLRGELRQEKQAAKEMRGR